MNFLMIPHFIGMVILETNKFHSLVCLMLFYIQMFWFSLPLPHFCYAGGGGGFYIKVNYKYG